MTLKKSAPIIGINAQVLERDSPGKHHIDVRVTYIDAVREAGGIPIVLPAIEDADLVSEERGYREQIAAACYAHAAPTGRLSAVLYDGEVCLGGGVIASGVAAS